MINPIHSYSLSDFVCSGEAVSVYFRKGYDFLGKDGSVPHSIDCFMLVLVISGSGYHMIGSKKYAVKPMRVHMVFPDQPHAINLDPGAKVYTLMLDFEAYNSFSNRFKITFSLYQNYPVIPLSQKGFSNMKSGFKSIKSECKTGSQNHEIIKLHLMIIGEIINREVFKYFQVEEKGTNALLASYISLIEKYFRENKEVGFYAKRLKVTVGHLNFCCRKHLSCTSTQLLHNRIIEEAKREFNAGTLSIKEVGFSLGFYDISYFTRFFRTKTGITPKKFQTLCS